MATVTCTIKYDEKSGKLIKTYQVLFDQKDTIKVLTETPGLAIKAGNPRARKLFPALTNGSARRPKTVVRPYEFDPPLVRTNAKKRSATASAPKASQFCFSGSENKVAEFVCGIRVNGKFQSYPDGPEFPT